MSKGFAVSLAVVCLGATFYPAESIADSQYFSMSGSQCMQETSGPPLASLFWGADGLDNIISATTSAVVVCPIVWSGMTADVTNPGSYVKVVYRDADGTTALDSNVACVWDITDSLGNVSIGAERYACHADLINGCPSDSELSFTSTTGVGNTLVLSRPPVTQISNMSLVCIIPRGSRIIGYWLFTPTHNGV